MSYTISDLKSDASNHLHGTNLNKLPDVEGLIYEAARNLLNKSDPRETKRIQYLNNAMYDDVYSYVLPTDLKGRKIVDIRPQANQTVSDEFYQWYNREFQQYKTSGTFAIQDDGGVKTIQISKELQTGATIDTLDSIDDNGEWIASGDASGLAEDNIYFITGSASLKFTVGASGSSALLTNATLSAVDLSEYENQGAIFVPVFLSSPDPVTGIKLKWGSGASDYWHRTVTASADATEFRTGWNILRFDWDGANETGTPDVTAIDYVQLEIQYDGTEITTVRVDNIVARLPNIYYVEYYSKYLFQNASGTWIEKPEDDTDIVNLDTESYNVLLYEFLVLVAQVNQGEEAKFDVEFFKQQLDEQWASYKADNPSEAIKPQSTYYRNLYNRRR